MALIGCVTDKFSARPGQPVAGDLQGDQRALRSAGGHQPAGSFGKTEKFDHPGNELALHIDGDMIAPA